MSSTLFSSSFSSPAQHEVVDSTAILWSTGRYSDVTIECEGKTFNVHKAVVCMQSPVIAAACDGAFKEAHTNTIQVTEFDAETVRRMLEYMYTGKYNVGTVAAAVEKQEGRDHTAPNKTPAASDAGKLGKPTSWFPAIAPEALLYEVRVNAIAGYYDVPRLQATATSHVQGILRSQWNANGFFNALEEAVKTTDDKALLGVLTDATVQHIRELVQCERFDQMVNLGDFLLGVMKRMAASFERERNDLKTQITASKALGKAGSYTPASAASGLFSNVTGGTSTAGTSSLFGTTPSLGTPTTDPFGTGHSAG